MTLTPSAVWQLQTSSTYATVGHASHTAVLARSMLHVISARSRFSCNIKHFIAIHNVYNSTSVWLRDDFLYINFRLYDIAIIRNDISNKIAILWYQPLKCVPLTIVRRGGVNSIRDDFLRSLLLWTFFGTRLKNEYITDHVRWWWWWCLGATKR